MMTYIFIGVLIVLFLAILLTLRNDESKSKKIESLQSTIKTNEQKNDHLQATCECLTNDNSVLSQNLQHYKDKANFFENVFKETDKNWKDETSKLSLQNLSEAQLKRWELLVADCKKPFEKRKQPINVGGKFTRSTIIAVGEIIDAVKFFNETDAQ